MEREISEDIQQVTKKVHLEKEEGASVDGGERGYERESYCQ